MIAIASAYSTTFNSYCTCTYCPKCEFTNAGEDKCDECGTETQPSSQCYDDCWEWAYEDWKDNNFPDWLTAVGNPEYIKVEGKGMGWRNLNGTGYSSASWKSLWDLLTLNGDWTITFTVKDKSLTATRSSHDEPTGASFVIKPCSTKEYEQNT